MIKIIDVGTAGDRTPPTDPGARNGRSRIGFNVTLMLKSAVVTIAGIVFVGLSATGPVQAQTREFRLSSGAAETHPKAQAVLKFSALVKQRSGGKILITLYPSGKLGDDFKSVADLQHGKLEMALPDSAALIAQVDGFGLLNLPFLFNSETDADQLLDGSFGQKLSDSLEKTGLIGLGLWENGFRHVTNNTREITRTSDFRGLRIRVIQNPLYIDMFQALGSTPVPIPFPDVYAALQTKTVDGQENSLAQIESAKFYNVQKYLTLTRHSYGLSVLLMSKKTWDQLSQDERTLIKKCAIEARDYERKLMRSNDEAILANLKKAGMVISEPSSIERSELRKLTRPIIDKYKSKFGKEWAQEMYLGMMHNEVAKFKGR